MASRDAKNANPSPFGDNAGAVARPRSVHSANSPRSRFAARSHRNLPASSITWSGEMPSGRSSTRVGQIAPPTSTTASGGLNRQSTASVTKSCSTPPDGAGRRRRGASEAIVSTPPEATSTAMKVFSKWTGALRSTRLHNRTRPNRPSDKALVPVCSTLRHRPGGPSIANCSAGRPFVGSSRHKTLSLVASAAAAITRVPSCNQAMLDKSPRGAFDTTRESTPSDPSPPHALRSPNRAATSRQRLTGGTSSGDRRPTSALPRTWWRSHKWPFGSWDRSRRRTGRGRHARSSSHRSRHRQTRDRSQD